MPSTPTTATIVLNQAVFRGLSTFIARLRFTGFDAENRPIYGPVTLEKASRVVLEGVPLETRRLHVEYLSVTDVVVGVADIPIEGLQPGQVLEIDDPSWTDAPPARFAVRENYRRLGLYPDNFRSGDFNGDGFVDLFCLTRLVIGNRAESSHVDVAPGDGRGGLGEPFRVYLPECQVAEVGDVNGDGNLDVVTLYRSIPNPQVLSVLLGNGDGTLQAPLNRPLPQDVARLSVSDLNSDGLSDLLLPNPGTGQVDVHLSVGDGTFVLADSIPGSVPANGSRSVGDFDGDGIPDLLATNPFDVLVLHRGAGDGTFSPLGASAPLGASPERVAIGDFNGDARDDLAVVVQPPFPVPKELRIFLTDAAGVPVQQPGTVSIPIDQISAGDADGDGRVDLLVSADDFLVLRGRGDGSFLPAIASELGRGGVFALGDFDRDGRLDVMKGFGIYGALFAPGRGDGTFGLGLEPVPESLRAARFWDLNRDGRDDLAYLVPEALGHALTVRLAGPDGTLGSPQRYDIEVQGTTPNGSVGVADFNRDGWPDLLLGMVGPPVCCVVLNRGDGTFGDETVLYQGGGTTTPLASGDLNGDGVVDIVSVVDSATAEVFVQFGNEDGSFQPARGFLYNVVAQPQSGSLDLAVGDMNGDGLDDVVVASRTDLRTLLSLPEGGLGEPSVAPTGALEAGALELSDLNGDGHLDAAVTVPFEDAVLCLFGDGQGNFSSARRVPVGTFPTPLAVVDFNRDGRPDLVTGNLNADTATVLLGVGDGSFDREDVAVGPDPTLIFAPDLNGDGLPDLAASNALEYVLNLLLQLP
ncbi:MAG: VCBS repeat-containing protein [Candidatus Eremiobacterota bacterium]